MRQKTFRFENQSALQMISEVLAVSWRTSWFNQLRDTPRNLATSETPLSAGRVGHSAAQKSRGQRRILVKRTRGD